MVTDQNALTGGSSPLANVSVYLCLLPSIGLPLGSTRVNGYIASMAPP